MEKVVGRCLEVEAGGFGEGLRSAREAEGGSNSSL